MTVLQYLRRLVTRRDPSTRTTANDPRASAGTTEWSTRLFHCDACDVTVVCRECAACPRCDGGVERVPTDRDLGHV